MAQFVWPRGPKFTSATLADHGDGSQTGMIREEAGRKYILVKNGTSASATIADGAACRSVKGATVAYTSYLTAELKVVITDTITDTIVCANNTGAAVPGDHYFWGLMQGRGYCLAGASIDADGLGLIPHATDGAMTAITTGATTAHCGFCITDLDTTVVTTNAVFWDLPSKNEGA